MLKHFLLAAFAASLFFANIALAQEHFNHQHNGPTNYSQLSAEAEHALACARMEEEQHSPNKPPFGFWGHGHAEAHCKGWVAQLMAAEKSSCCDGIDSGECRLTSINMQTRQAYVDGMWCSIGTANPVFIQDMGPYALVCASRTSPEQRAEKICPSIYCMGSSVAN